MMATGKNHTGIFRKILVKFIRGEKQDGFFGKLLNDMYKSGG